MTKKNGSTLKKGKGNASVKSASTKPLTKRPKKSAGSGMGTAFDVSDSRFFENLQSGDYPYDSTEKKPRERKKLLSPKESLQKKSKRGVEQKQDKKEKAKTADKPTKNKPEKAAAPVSPSKKSKKTQPVKVIFLGGVGEIGKNMTAIEYGDDIIVIDAGMTFPNGEDMPGIDAVVPDVTYLVQNKHKIRGIFLTHGHEDHIGGIAYLLKDIYPDTTIYGTKLTLMLTDNKLQERHVQSVQKVVSAGDRVQAGVFEVEFINVNHSISGATALAIRTPRGLIYHSGDYKIDLTPVAGEPIDLPRLSKLGEEGVLLYMGESTNIERPGYTLSETVVGTTFDHLFAENATRRIIIATFASNVHRLQQIIDMAVKYRRKVALSGRSMFKVVEAALKIGELAIPDGVLVDIERTKNLFDGELVIISTGSQGEPMSALTRMADGEFNKVVVGENDTIIISASPIPGNEKMIYRVINNLYKRGARVVYESLEKIHVSGHACQEEHKILHTLLKPKFFIPVHGEYRHLKRHVELAQDLGMPAYNTLITEIGNCVELTEKSMTLAENVPAGTRLIDGEGVEDYGKSEVMKDRLKMSAEGLYVISIAVTGNYVLNDPCVESRGIVVSGNGDDEREIKAVVQKTIENFTYQYGDKKELSAAVYRAVKNHVYKKAKQSPMIVINIIDV